MSGNQVLLKRFENEFRAASKLNHPNIVRALDYGTEDGRPFLVMEFVDGESLGQRLERDGRIPEAEAVRIIAEAAQGLDAAHKQGLIHRDIKPDNIMVTHDGQVKVADLGLVKDVDAELNLTRTGRGLGTPHFMAPEQFRNAKNADVRCDVYSLGATLYMMVTGDLPFKSCTPLDAWMKKSKNDLPAPRKVNPKVSERLNTAIMRSMSAEPTRRPANCLEFVADLSGAEPEPAKPPEMWYLIYKDNQGEVHTVKGTAVGIRRSFKNGELGEANNIRASRTKTGDFKPLLSLPDFADLLESVRKSTESTEELPTFSQIASDPTSSGAAVPERAATTEEVEAAAPAVKARPVIPEWLLSALLLIGALALGVTLFFLLNR
jgi:serine/threonine protein kinase